jgi:hypothetical protein
MALPLMSASLLGNCRTANRGRSGGILAQLAFSAYSVMSISPRLFALIHGRDLFPF